MPYPPKRRGMKNRSKEEVQIHNKEVLNKLKSGNIKGQGNQNKLHKAARDLFIHEMKEYSKGSWPQKAIDNKKRALQKILETGNGTVSSGNTSASVEFVFKHGKLAIIQRNDEDGILIYSEYPWSDKDYQKYWVFGKGKFEPEIAHHGIFDINDGKGDPEIAKLAEQIVRKYLQK